MSRTFYARLEAYICMLICYTKCSGPYSSLLQYINTVHRASSRVGNRAFEQLRKTLALKESPEEEHDAKALYFAQLQNFNEFRRMKR